MKGILIIAGVWILLNISSYYLIGPIGPVISTYGCMFVIWTGRTKLGKLLNI